MALEEEICGGSKKTLVFILTLYSSTVLIRILVYNFSHNTILNDLTNQVFNQFRKFISIIMLLKIHLTNSGVS